MFSEEEYAVGIGNLYLGWIFVSRQIIYYTNRTMTDFVCSFTSGENFLVTDTGLSIHKIFVERNNLLLYRTSQLVLILNSYSDVGFIIYIWIFLSFFKFTIQRTTRMLCFLQNSLPILYRVLHKTSYMNSPRDGSIMSMF